MKKSILLISILVLIAVIGVGIWFARKPDTKISDNLTLGDPETKLKAEEYTPAEPLKKINTEIISKYFNQYRMYGDDNQITPNLFISLNKANLSQISESEYNQVMDTGIDLIQGLNPNSSYIKKVGGCIKFYFDNLETKDLCNDVVDADDYGDGYEYMGYSPELHLHVVKKIGFEGSGRYLIIDQASGTEDVLYFDKSHKYSVDKTLLVSYESGMGVFRNSGISFVGINETNQNIFNPYGGYVNGGGWEVHEVKIDNQNNTYFKVMAVWPNFEKSYSYFKQII